MMNRIKIEQCAPERLATSRTQTPTPPPELASSSRLSLIAALPIKRSAKCNGSEDLTMYNVFLEEKRQRERTASVPEVLSGAALKRRQALAQRYRESCCKAVVKLL